MKVRWTGEPNLLWGAALVAGLYGLHAAVFGDYVADDAGISLAYARNVVQGHGPVLHPGAEVVEGYSNPLWTALLAAGVLLGMDSRDGIVLFKALSLLFGVGTLALTRPAARALYPGNSRIVWLAPALLAAFTPYVFWTIAGLENALYAFLMLLAVTLQAYELRTAHGRPWSAAALGSLALTRPEGIAFVVPFAAHRLLLRDRPRRFAVWLAVVAGVYGVFIVSRLLMFGDWLPNTYYAKVTIYGRQLADLPAYLRSADDRGMDYVLRSAAAVWPLLAAAALGLAGRRHWQNSALLVSIIGGTAFYAIYVGGDFWPAGRFFTAVLPLLALGIQQLFNRIPARRPLLLSAAAAVLTGLVLNRSLEASSSLRVLYEGRALISLQGRLETANRLRATATALGIQDPLVLDPDIGGLAVAGLRIVDLGGLTDSRIARHHYEPVFFRRHVFEVKRPHFIRTHATWTRSSRVSAYPEFQQRYVAIHSWRDADGLHGEFVRRDLLPQ